jgi:hypothetical protein
MSHPDTFTHDPDPPHRPHRPIFKKWSAEEWQTVVELRALGHDTKYIAGVLHRQERHVREKIRWEGYSKDRRDQIKERTNARRRKDSYTTVEDKSSSSKATPEMLADRERRLLAPRSLSAIAFGDPPPGFSALDRRRA